MASPLRTGAIALVPGLLFGSLVGAARADDADAPAAERDDEEPGEFHVAKHPWYAVAEVTALLAGGGVWYWWDADFNRRDWELDWNAASWKKKLITFEAVRLDNNTFATNALAHTRAGLAFYLVGRGNGFSMPASFVLTAVSGAAWEYLLEFREKVSLNDLIVDPVGGLAIGEPFFQLAGFFSRGKNTAINRTLSTLFSPASAVNEWANGHQVRTAPDTDALGLPLDTWHHFDLHVSWLNAAFPDGGERSETTLGIGAALNNLPSYGRPGVVSRWVGPARVVSTAGSISFASGSTTAATLASSTSLGGYHAQNLLADGLLGLTGYSVSLGLVTDAEYSRRDRPDRNPDQLGRFGVLGPTAEAVWFHGNLRAQISGTAMGDFAVVHALALDSPAAADAIAGQRSVLVQRSYYYAWGLSAVGHARVGFKAWDLGFDALIDGLNSIEGLDRFQEKVSNDSHLTDQRLFRRAWTSFRPARGYVQFSFALESLRRSGSLAASPQPIQASTYERRAILTLALTL